MYWLEQQSSWAIKSKIGFRIIVRLVIQESYCDYVLRDYTDYHK